jgi:hypothetical protein
VADRIEAEALEDPLAAPRSLSNIAAAIPTSADRRPARPMSGGRTLGAQNGEMAFPAPAEKLIDFNFGADLQPGLYRLRLWAVCTPVRDLKLNAEILIKGPSDMNLRPLAADDLVHQGG